MKIIADCAIPFLEDVLTPFAEVVRIAGKAITAADVRDADALIVRTRTRCDARLLAGSRVRMIATATIGFDHDMVDSDAYRRVAGKLHTYIPESSIVGVLLEHAEDYAVIDSTNRSIMQHEPMSWSVLGPRFVHLGQRSQMGKLSDDVLRQWIGSMTPQEREQFSDALFDVLSLSGKARTLDDLRAGGLAGGAALLKQYSGADEQDKKIIAEIFRRLAVDVKTELKKAAGQGLKTAEKGLTGVKNAITGLTKGDRNDT